MRQETVEHYLPQAGILRRFSVFNKAPPEKVDKYFKNCSMKAKIFVNFYSPPNEGNHSQIATVSITKIYSRGISYIA